MFLFSTNSRERPQHLAWVQPLLYNTGSRNFLGSHKLAEDRAIAKGVGRRGFLWFVLICSSEQIGINRVIPQNKERKSEVIGTNWGDPFLVTPNRGLREDRIWADQPWTNVSVHLGNGLWHCVFSSQNSVQVALLDVDLEIWGGTSAELKCLESFELQTKHGMKNAPTCSRNI